MVLFIKIKRVKIIFDLLQKARLVLPVQLLAEFLNVPQLLQVEVALEFDGYELAVDYRDLFG